MELAVAISAEEKAAEKPPCSIMAGIRTLPSAATVAGPEPEMAPKKQATITHTMAIPPRRCPTQVLTNLISRLEMPAFAMILPDNTKNGIASKRNLLIPEYILVATMVSEVPEYRIAQMEDRPRQILIGIPIIRKMKKEINKKIEIIIYGFAAGVMMAALIWSLIIPAMEQSVSIVPIVIGLVIGVVIFFVIDKVMDGKVKKIDNLMLAVTLHNIPEGMAVGVAFASYLSGGLSLAAAYALSIGIAIQNFPEGSVISFPLLKKGYSKNKAFLYGYLLLLFG